MNKNVIQRFAIWARTELIAQVSQRAYQYNITADGYGDYDAVAVSGRVLSDDERKQRQELIGQIRNKGYAQVMEEVAYTWFNRFIALRFMEVNNYLPTHIRVFSDASGAFKPQILSDVLHLDLPGLDMEKVSDLIEKNQTEDLYRYLLLTQCNALNTALPRMFERMGSYTELLLPNNILRQDGVLGRMVADIPEEDWTDQVQIIGWLYQYYNTELKNETFALLKKNVKVTKERIPSATQLFTPDWIVRYMVENSLGRLWLEGHPDDELKAGWKYYLDEAEQEQDVRAQLETIRAEYRNIKPQDIKVIDPCMGSGHILVYAFDVLVEIYKKVGFNERDAAQSIIQHNLHGLDIDERAAQLAYFSVMMKARQYDRRFFSRNLQPMVYSTTGDEDGENFGSLVMVDDSGEMPEEPQSIFDLPDYERRVNVWNYRYLLAQKYDVVVTNPPYMGSDNMNNKLDLYCRKHYPKSRFDLCAVYIERCKSFIKKNKFLSMITQHSWMYLQSYKGLRQTIMKSDVVNMAHLGARAFEDLQGEVVQTTTFVFRNSDIKTYKGIYIRLNEIPTSEKESEFLSRRRLFCSSKDKFLRIPGYNWGYWVSEATLKVFDRCEQISKIAQPRQGLATGNNSRFYRFWQEVVFSKIVFAATSKEDVWRGGYKYVPVNKGGGFCKWYGNNFEIIRFDEKNYNLLLNNGNHLPSRDKYFLAGVTWGKIASTGFSCRYTEIGFVFTDSGMKITGSNIKLKYICAFLHSKVAPEYLKIFSETIHYETGNISKLPIKFTTEAEPNILKIVDNCILLARIDWDSFETSWDFKKHPLI